MTTTVSHEAARSTALPARLTEVRIARASFAVLALHFVDANFLQPRPGTSAGDHLASGLLPAAILVAAGVIYPRLRAGVRAAVAMTFGALGIAIGFPGVYYLLDGSASGAHYSGLLAIAAGAVLLATGPVTLWRSRRTGGSRRQRYVRRAATVVLGTLAAAVIFAYVVFPIGFSYGYTHVGRTGPPADLGIPVETVSVPTSDGLVLACSVRPVPQPRCGRRVPRLLGHQRGPDDRESRVWRSSSRPARPGRK